MGSKQDIFSKGEHIIDLFNQFFGREEHNSMTKKEIMLYLVHIANYRYGMKKSISSEEHQLSEYLNSNKINPRSAQYQLNAYFEIDKSLRYYAKNVKHKKFNIKQALALSRSQERERHFKLGQDIINEGLLLIEDVWSKWR